MLVVTTSFLLFAVVVCSLLPNIQFGNVIYSDATRGVNTTATFSCDNGLVLDGSSVRTCTTGQSANGSWTGSQPSCERKYSLEYTEIVHSIYFCVKLLRYRCCIYLGNTHLNVKYSDIGVVYI